jgi:drug/metabolite transporter (DMT)-like permease
MEFVVGTLPTITLVFLRVFVSAISFFLIAYFMNVPLPKSLKTWALMLGLGSYALALPFSLITWSQIHLDSSLVGILTPTVPLVTALLAHFLTEDEKLTKATIIGLTLGIAGASIIIGPSALGSFDVTSIAQFALIAAFSCFALANISFKKMGHVHPVMLNAGMMLGAALWLLPLSLAQSEQWYVPETSMILALAAQIFIGTVLAYIIYLVIIGRAGATNAALVTFLIPIVTILLGTLILGERPAPSAYLGMVVIFIGLMIKDRRIPFLKF